MGDVRPHRSPSGLSAAETHVNQRYLSDALFEAMRCPAGQRILQRNLMNPILVLRIAIFGDSG
jgi:hypothetical protein